VRRASVAVSAGSLNWSTYDSQINLSFITHSSINKEFAMKRSVLIAAMCLATAGLVYAQDAPATGNTKTPVVNQRQKNQHARIKEGVKSGELTKGEARKLHAEEKTIQEEKQMAKADGKVTKAERAKLHHDQNKASKDIHRMKHNAKTQADPSGK
jgi:hypothetical protein